MQMKVFFFVVFLFPYTMLPRGLKAYPNPNPNLTLTDWRGMREEDLRPEQVIEQGCDQDVRAQLVLDQGLRAQLVNETPTAKRPAWLATETDHEKRIRLDAKSAKAADKRAAETDDERRSRLDAKNAGLAARVAAETDEEKRSRLDASNARAAARYKSRVALKSIGNETNNETNNERRARLDVRNGKDAARKARNAAKTDDERRFRLDVRNGKQALKRKALDTTISNETDDERGAESDVNG
jgi:hypothetical protein